LYVRFLCSLYQPKTHTHAHTRTHTHTHTYIHTQYDAEVITTNYDVLFERARQNAQRPIAVIPHNFEKTADKGWLLKIHGCVTAPETIVLSRDDYMGYDWNRGALTAVVQAMLITKHMLFVGFSLNDYNFHKTISAVTSASLGTVRHMKLGHSLQLVSDPLTEELWKRDLTILSMVPRDKKKYAHDWQQFPFASRRLEMFLDVVASHLSEGISFSLDKRYQRLMPPPDRICAKVLEGLYNNAPDLAKNTIG